MTERLNVFAYDNDTPLGSVNVEVLTVERAGHVEVFPVTPVTIYIVRAGEVNRLAASVPVLGHVPLPLRGGPMLVKTGDTVTLDFRDAAMLSGSIST